MINHIATVVKEERGLQGNVPSFKYADSLCESLASRRELQHWAKCFGPCREIKQKWTRPENFDIGFSVIFDQRYTGH